jgi:hypothetical protein
LGEEKLKLKRKNLREGRSQGSIGRVYNGKKLGEGFLLGGEGGEEKQWLANDPSTNGLVPIYVRIYYNQRSKFLA